VCWFLPADHTIGGNLSGWDAFAPALSPDTYLQVSNYAQFLWLLSAWTNLLFVVAFALVVARRYAPSRALMWALASVAILNLVWWLLTERGSLRVGFYLWILSFACLAVAASLPRPHAGAAGA
jgi:hypothetical protein